MMGSKGRILQLQNYSVNDGDGIRTTIFFAGCPLRCRWCANPEGYTAKNQILYISSRCVRCGRCAAVCPQGINVDFSLPPDARRLCTGCGACTEVCLEQARKNTAAEYTVDEVIKHIEPQLRFFRRSGGGVTYSGGECTAQAAFLSELVDAVYDMGLDQAMETSGYFDLPSLQPVLDKIDLLFIDIKLMDRQQHRQYTGVDNDVILANVAAVGARQRRVVVRVPVVMGVNGSDGNIRETAQFVKAHVQDPKMELLPYHSYGADKYVQLGMAYDGSNFRSPTAEEMQHLEDIVKSEGVSVVSFT